MFYSSTRHGVKKITQKNQRNEEERTQRLFTLPFKRLNLCLVAICVRLHLWYWEVNLGGEPDHKGSNPSKNDKEKAEEICTTEKYSWICNKRNSTFTCYSSNLENDKPEWHTSTPHLNRFQQLPQLPVLCKLMKER